MLNKRNLARPYAKAAFEQAISDHQLQAWLDFLQLGSKHLSDTKLHSYLQHPKTTPEQVYQCFILLLQATLFTQTKNFLKLLIKNKRWRLFSVITELFKQLQFEYEKKLSVEIRSATQLTDIECTRVEHLLSQHLQKTLHIKHSVDPSLLGGLVIHIGDQVIDCSVRNSLKKLRAVLT